MSNHDPSDDTELADLRARMRSQWRNQRRAHEREAIRERWLQRNLIDVVIEAMHRGDAVTFHIADGPALSGLVVSAGRDYAVIELAHPPHRRYAVRLASDARRKTNDPYAGPSVMVEVRTRGAHGGTNAPPDAPRTFQAVLQQYDFQQQLAPQHPVEIGTTFHPNGLIATLQAHALDHLYLRDRNGRQLFIPAGDIRYITWAEDR